MLSSILECLNGVDLKLLLLFWLCFPAVTDLFLKLCGNAFHMLLWKIESPKSCMSYFSITHWEWTNKGKFQGWDGSRGGWVKCCQILYILNNKKKKKKRALLKFLSFGSALCWTIPMDWTTKPWGNSSKVWHNLEPWCALTNLIV